MDIDQLNIHQILLYGGVVVFVLVSLWYWFVWARQKRRISAQQTQIYDWAVNCGDLAATNEINQYQSEQGAQSINTSRHQHTDAQREVVVLRQVVKELAKKCQENEAAGRSGSGSGLFRRRGSSQNRSRDKKLAQRVDEHRKQAKQVFEGMATAGPDANSRNQNLAAARRLNVRAAELAQFMHNSHRNVQTLDLHLLHKSEALEQVQRRLELLDDLQLSKLTLIVGQGRHSTDNLPVLKPAIQEYLARSNIPFAESPNNPGELQITVPRPMNRTTVQILNEC